MAGHLHQGWEPLTRRDDQPGFEHNPAMPPELRGDEIWLSSRYQCVVRYMKSEHPQTPKGREGMMHLSIHATDRGPMRNWRHLQQIKNEVAGELRTAVEIFPPEHLLTDTSNEYHLWVLPEGVELPFGIHDAPLVSTDEVAQRYNESPHKGRQEEWEPGLTTGRTEHSAASRDRMTKAHDEFSERGGAL